MRPDIHPEYTETTISCACGTSYVTRSTVPDLRVAICSKCHPFYTGEQRIVDTEGQVDRFLGRLRERDRMRSEAEQRRLARTPPDLPLAELGVGKRYLTIFARHEIAVAQDALTALAEGDAALLELPGIGRKVVADLKRALRLRGYDLPASESDEEPAEAAVAEA